MPAAHRVRRLARRRRWLLFGGLGLSVLVVAWAIGAYLVIVDPTVNRVTRADAIVVLGGATVDGRLDRGLELAKAGDAPALLISTPPGSGSFVGNVCTTPLPGVQVTCFVPSPTTTQGEAREIRAMAAARGWHTLLVVTSTYHISRARLIISRCFSGRILMVSAAPPSLGEWIYNLAYQTGAYVKALVSSGC